MNSLVALPIVAALPVAAPAMPSAIANETDAALVQAAFGLQAADQAINHLCKKFGDDADDREDYLELEYRRNEHIATLITVPARSTAGVQAKAASVRLRALIEDYDQHQQVAVSLADDLVARGAQLGRPVAGDEHPDPVYAAIEAHQKAYVAVRAAVAESDRLCELADKLAGKCEVSVPGFGVADCYSDLAAYLPGEENKKLRQLYLDRLDEISAARKAVYGDIDAVVAGPASAECDIVDELMETVPTTLPGLLTFLVYLDKAYRRDPELFYDQHVEPLIRGLGKAAAALS
jgi:hypothetical protein